MSPEQLDRKLRTTGKEPFEEDFDGYAACAAGRWGRDPGLVSCPATVEAGRFGRSFGSTFRRVRVGSGLMKPPSTARQADPHPLPAPGHDKRTAPSRDRRIDEPVRRGRSNECGAGWRLGAAKAIFRAGKQREALAMARSRR